MTKSLNVLELECSACGKKYDPSVEQHLCMCGKPLLARYHLRRAAATLNLESLKSRPRTLWRYAEVLPNDPAVSLGEGMTALVHAERLGASIHCGQGGMQRLYVKDEGLNPTGSFKARGMTTAVSRAKQLGAKALAAPTAGNAGGERDGMPSLWRQGRQAERPDLGLRQICGRAQGHRRLVRRLYAQGAVPRRR